MRCQRDCKGWPREKVGEAGIDHRHHHDGDENNDDNGYQWVSPQNETLLSMQLSPKPYVAINGLSHNNERLLSMRWPGVMMKMMMLMMIMVMVLL